MSCNPPVEKLSSNSGWSCRNYSSLVGFSFCDLSKNFLTFRFLHALWPPDFRCGDSFLLKVNHMHKGILIRANIPGGTAVKYLEESHHFFRSLVGRRRLQASEWQCQAFQWQSLRHPQFQVDFITPQKTSIEHKLQPTEAWRHFSLLPKWWFLEVRNGQNSHNYILCAFLVISHGVVVSQFWKKNVPTPFQPHFSGYLVENFNRYRVLHQRWSWDGHRVSSPEPEPEPSPRFQNKIEEAPSFNGKTFKQSIVPRTYPSHITYLRFVDYTEYPNYKKMFFFCH